MARDLKLRACLDAFSSSDKVINFETDEVRNVAEAYGRNVRRVYSLALFPPMAISLAIAIQRVVDKVQHEHPSAERMPAYLKVYILVTVLLAVLTSSAFLGSKPRVLLPALLLGFPLAKVLAPVRDDVLVVMIAILAVASAWLTLSAAAMGIVP